MCDFNYPSNLLSNHMKYPLPLRAWLEASGTATGRCLSSCQRQGAEVGTC